MQCTCCNMYGREKADHQHELLHFRSQGHYALPSYLHLRLHIRLYEVGSKPIRHASLHMQDT